MQKIIYFTAGDVATNLEISDIEALNAFVKKEYEVLVRNRTASQEYGAGPEEGDFVAGTPPSGLPWSEIPEWVYPEPEGIEPNQAIVENNDVIEITAGGKEVNATVAISESAITGVTLIATAAIVENEDTLTIEDEDGNEASAEASVAAGAITGVVIEGTKTIVSDAQTFEGVTGAGSNTVATITVVDGAITAIACTEPA